MVTKINGQAATGLGIKLATGANALDTAAAIKSKLAQLQPFFPQGLKVVYPYDTTPFVKISIHEVVKTLFEAIILVFLVMYLSCKICAQRSFLRLRCLSYCSAPLPCWRRSASRSTP